MLVLMDSTSLVSKEFKLSLRKNRALEDLSVHLLNAGRQPMEVVSTTLRMFMRIETKFTSIDILKELWSTDLDNPFYLTQGIMAARMASKISTAVNIGIVMGHSDRRIVAYLVEMVIRNKEKVEPGKDLLEERQNAGLAVERWCNTVGESFGLLMLDKLKTICTSMITYR